MAPSPDDPGTSSRQVVTASSFSLTLNGNRIANTQALAASIKALPTKNKRLALFLSTDGAEFGDNDERKDFLESPGNLPDIVKEAKKKKRGKIGKAFDRIDKVMKNERGEPFSYWLKHYWKHADAKLAAMSKVCEDLKGDTVKIIRYLNAAMMNRLVKNPTRTELSYTLQIINLAKTWINKEQPIFEFSDYNMRMFGFKKRELGQLVADDGFQELMMSFDDKQAVLPGSSTKGAIQDSITLPFETVSQVGVGVEKPAGEGKNRGYASNNPIADVSQNLENTSQTGAALETVSEVQASKANPPTSGVASAETEMRNKLMSQSQKLKEKELSKKTVNDDDESKSHSVLSKLSGLDDEDPYADELAGPSPLSRRITKLDKKHPRAESVAGITTGSPAKKKSKSGNGTPSNTLTKPSGPEGGTLNICSRRRKQRTRRSSRVDTVFEQ